MHAARLLPIVLIVVVLASCSRSNPSFLAGVRINCTLAPFWISFRYAETVPWPNPVSATIASMLLPVR